MEDLNDYIQGFHFNEDNEDGNIIRKNYYSLINEITKLHTIFWENVNAFEHIGLD